MITSGGGDHGRRRLLPGAAAFDLVVLDWMLPGRSLRILTGMRQRGIDTPVLIDGSRRSRSRCGLEPDDYLVKPFALSSFARVRALLRRTRPDKTASLKAADLEVDPVTREVTRGGEKLALTAREFELLEYLVRHKGRDRLARDARAGCLEGPFRGTPLDNVIDVHITHLRKKVDQGFAVKLLHTVRGVGFVVKEGGAQ